jgi:hypothetical protein
MPLVVTDLYWVDSSEDLAEGGLCLKIASEERDSGVRSGRAPSTFMAAEPLAR